MNVAVFFGGKSCEHDISVITGMQAVQALSPVHKVIPIYIDENGVWLTGKTLGSISSFKDGRKPKGKRVHFCPSSPVLRTFRGRRIAEIDAALLCNHGLNGEDGSLQGLLQLCGVPYTGSGVRASAVGMDKITMKELFLQAGLPVLPYVAFSREQFENEMFALTEKIKNSLRFPIIVKPANLGSSIGISIAHDFEQLFAAIEVALMWDNNIIAENALEDFTELNCAVLGVGADTEASEIEQPVGWTDFLTFDDKYTKKTKGGGRKFPADIDSDTREKVRSFAKTAFSRLGCSGVARVDFLLKDGELFVNEINTIPGSLANYLFDFPFSDLIDKLLDIAVERNKAEQALTYSYKSERGDSLKGKK